MARDCPLLDDVFAAAWLLRSGGQQGLPLCRLLSRGHGRHGGGRGLELPPLCSRERREDVAGRREGGRGLNFRGAPPVWEKEKDRRFSSLKFEGRLEREKPFISTR